jgi:hypothetical protein
MGGSETAYPLMNSNHGSRGRSRTNRCRKNDSPANEAHEPVQKRTEERVRRTGSCKFLI